MFYAAITHTDAPGYGFTIPDLPGFSAHSESTSLTAAVAEARTVLRDYLAAMVDHGQTPPEPTDLADVVSDAEPGAAVILIPALMPARRMVRINISTDESTLALIDAKAKARGLTRSAYLVAAAEAMD